MANEMTFPLTGEQKNEIHRLVDSPVFGAPLADVKANRHLRVFAVNFDGTENDRDAVPSGYQSTLVSDSYEQLRDADDQRLVSHYIHGVATRTNAIRRAIEATTGRGCKLRAEMAHATLAEQAKKWIAEDPEAEIHVHVVGFSRGAATALHFMNMVDKYGAIDKSLRGPFPHDQLTAGRVLTSAVLYDTVATGQYMTLDLTVPKTAMSVLHLVAGGEERVLFPVQNIADTSNAEVCAFVQRDPLTGKSSDEMLHFKRIHEVVIPGARHSDVGGSYIGGNLREVSAFLANTFQQSLGLPVEAVKPTFKSIQDAEFHDSRFVKISNDPADRQSASDRLTAGSPKISDKSDYMLHMGVSGLDSEGAKSGSPGVKNFSDYGRVKDGDWGEALKGLYDHQLDMKICPRDRNEPMDINDPFALIGLKVATALPGVFSIDRDGYLNLCEKRLPGLPSLPELSVSLQKRQALGEKAEIDLSISPRHFGGACTITRSPSSPLPQCSVEADPWPEGIRQQIMKANVSEKMTQREATYIMNEAIFAAAKALQKEGLADGDVIITSKRITERSAIGVKSKNGFEIKCEHEGREIGNTMQPSTLADRNLRRRILEVATGLDGLGSALRDRGYRPRQDNRFVISANATAPILDLASMESIEMAARLADRSDGHGYEVTTKVALSQPLMPQGHPAYATNHSHATVWHLGVDGQRNVDAEMSGGAHNLYKEAMAAISPKTPPVLELNETVVRAPSIKVGSYLFGALKGQEPDPERRSPRPGRG